MYLQIAKEITKSLLDGKSAEDAIPKETPHREKILEIVEEVLLDLDAVISHSSKMGILLRLLAEIAHILNNKAGKIDDYILQAQGTF